MPCETEEQDAIVVVGKRGSKPTIEPRLVINFGEFGRAGTSVTSKPIIDFLRSIINVETDFYISNAFSSDQREIIVKTIAGISNHPSFAAAFSAVCSQAPRWWSCSRILACLCSQTFSSSLFNSSQPSILRSSIFLHTIRTCLIVKVESDGSRYPVATSLYPSPDGVQAPVA